MHVAPLLNSNPKRIAATTRIGTDGNTDHCIPSPDQLQIAGGQFLRCLQHTLRPVERGTGQHDKFDSLLDTLDGGFCGTGRARKTPPPGTPAR